MASSRARRTRSNARESALLFSALTLAIASITASVAHADPPGCDALHVAIEGECCWPDQRVEAGRCVGAPRCPETLVEHGDDCVAPTDTPVAPRPIATYASSSTTETEGDEVVDWPSMVHHRDRPVWRVQARSSEDGGLVAASVVVIDVGWTLGWLGALLGQLQPCFSSECNMYAWAFIPVGGAMASGLDSLSRTGNGIAFSFGIPSVILQGIGLIMLAISLGNEVTEPLHQPIRPRVSFALGAPSSEMGASLGLSF